MSKTSRRTVLVMLSIVVAVKPRERAAEAASGSGDVATLEKAVVLDLHVDNSWAYVPEGGVVSGKDEEGKPVVVPEWPVRALTGKVSVPPGQVVVAKDVRDVSKAGQARTLVLVTARVAEAGAGGGK